MDTLTYQTLIGVDFTSTPSLKKPITLAKCQLEAGKPLGRLVFREAVDFTSLATFEDFLGQPGAWTGCFDFPFGQPLEWVRTLPGCPTDWAGYVMWLAEQGKAYFEGAVTAFLATRPVGGKFAYRPTDRLSRSSSAMKLRYPPVGKMFLVGAPALCRSDVSVLPCRPLADSTKVALEGYPALVARAFIGSSPYKTDDKAKQTPERTAARERLVSGLTDPNAPGWGRIGRPLSVILTDTQREALIVDPTGDQLDALLCAVQAAYAVLTPGYGIPDDPAVAPVEEGWIIGSEWGL